MQFSCEELSYFPDNYKNTEVDFIYNRFDLTYKTNWSFLLIKEKKKSDSLIPFHYEGTTGELGIWMVPASAHVIAYAAEYIFKTYAQIKRITYKNGVYGIDRNEMKNHFYVTLPDNAEELNNSLTRNIRYRIKHRTKLLEEEKGPLSYHAYEVPNIPEEIIKQFFTFKEKTHERNYALTAQQYIQKYHVSHAYTMVVQDKIIALILSCEQTPIVFFENTSYDVNFSQYSVGMIIYHHYLEGLIEKGFKTIYLGGGNLEYKQRYDSHENMLYNGTIYKSGFTRHKDILKESNKMLVKKILKSPHRLLHKKK